MNRTATLAMITLFGLLTLPLGIPAFSVESEPNLVESAQQELMFFQVILNHAIRQKKSIEIDDYRRILHCFDLLKEAFVKAGLIEADGPVQLSDELYARQFQITDPEDTKDNPAAIKRRTDFVHAIEQILEQMLYGAEGREKARQQGRMMIPNPIRGTIDVIDTSDNIKRVDAYLKSIREE